MAFSPKNLSVLAYANGFTLWHYLTTDAASTVDDRGYFNDAADMLRSGDMILLNSSSGGSIAVVASNASGVVDTANPTALGPTNAD